ncbi:4482_t:CDS:2 [Ambispora leptoticha]|uniref:4482_t:CDS:1 n=1 Tax=Ambispora leptoticha TaxID=144679 RepID=A0A9N9GGB4_9GLOM|nr:4482_t:CDS:2 [Ambispora leptoticha]
MNENTKSQSIDSSATTTVVGGGESTASFSTPQISGRDSTSSAAPEEKFSEVRLTLLLVSGKRHTFEFEPNDTIGNVKKRVFEEWPKEWSDEIPAAATNLKIVYLGRFLEDVSTLETNKIYAGQTTIAHLTIKNTVSSDSEDPKSAENAPRCQCTIL